jgi:hypothetical protein
MGVIEQKKQGMKRRQQVKKGIVEATSRKCTTDIGCGI